MTNRFDEFETAEQSGSTFVTAKPASGADEPVRFDASISDRGSTDEPEANWEEIVSTLAESHLGEKLTINDGRGVMDRDEAIEALVDSGSDHVRNEHAAHAVLEYLAHEDILQLEGDSVVLLESYEEIGEEASNAMLNNWAAMLDTCVNRIDAAVERVEQNRQTLEKHVENLESPASVKEDYDQRKKELEQELKALLGGRKPEELGEREKKQFDRKRKRYHRYEAMEESLESGVGGDPIDAAEMLSNLKIELEDLKRVLGEQSRHFRLVAATQNVRESGAREMVENLTDVVAQIGDVVDPENRMKKESDEEFVEDLFGVTETASERELEVSEEAQVSDTVNERR